MSLKQRRWNSYELTQLLKYRVDPDAIAGSDLPVEYITGWVEFAGLDLQITPAVLIPRYATEGLLELAAKYTRPDARILDIGTGSGAITLGLAARFRETPLSFTLTDISGAALQVARANVKRLASAAPHHTFSFVQSDLGSNLSEQYNLLLANLPYLPSARLTPQSSLRHEPQLALDGGVDGLDLIRKLIGQLPKLLTPDGVAILEVDDTHTELEATRLQGWSAVLHNDYEDKPRFWVVQSNAAQSGVAPSAQ